MNVSQVLLSRSVSATPKSHQPDSLAIAFAPPSIHNLGLAFLAALGYYTGMKIGFGLAPPQAPISGMWPPNAILLGILLLTPRRQWWLLLLAVLPTHFMLQRHAGIPLLTSFGWFLGNVGEAVLGAACVKHFVDPRRLFDTVRGAVTFLCFAVIMAPLATSFVDAAAVILTGWGRGYWELWTTRLFSNVLAELVFVPAIVSFRFHAPATVRRSHFTRRFEFACLALAVIATSILVFDTRYVSVLQTRALIYLPLSFFLWASLRFGIVGLSSCLLTVAVIAVQGALHGTGPFTSPSVTANILTMNVLLVTVATPLLLLTSVVAERRKTEQLLREVAQRLIDAQEEERGRIAHELHDDIGQQLALLTCGLYQLKQVLPPTQKVEVSVLEEQVEEISKSARELSHGLHPSHLEILGLESALQRLCQDTEERSGISVQFVANAAKSQLPRELALCLYRVSQEALQNVVRHSGASKVTVELTIGKMTVFLRIIDNGSGFAPSDTTHEGLGLVGMRERLRAVNGDIRFIADEGNGTTIEALVPMAISPDQKQQ